MASKRPLSTSSPSAVKSRRTESSSHVVPQDSKVNAASDERKLLTAMDYGTKTLAMAYRFAAPGVEPLPTNVFDVSFHGNGIEVSQKVAWTDDDEFLWGKSLDQALEENKVQQQDVIELCKLLLYKSHQTSSIVDAIKEQLGTRTIEELLSTHLHAVMKEAKAQIKDCWSSHISAKEIDNMPMHLLLSVPQMWQAPANRMMTEAAKRAGIAYVELIYEPQCAAAFYTHHIRYNLPRQLDSGDVILIADLGGGTGDFASYKYRESVDKGATVKLKATGFAKGLLCGSEFVNRNFLAWLQERPEFQGKCEELGITAKTCLTEAATQFERIKRSFTKKNEDSSWIIIRTATSWRLELTSADIVSFFEPVIKLVIQGIEEQLVPETKTVIIPGGFGRSQYLVDRLKTQYRGVLNIMGNVIPAFGASQPISRGALLRYDDIKPRGMPSKDAFGVGQTEDYDRLVHKDATYQPGEKLPNDTTCRKRQKRLDIVKRDAYSNRWIVRERWISLFPKGIVGEPGQPITRHIWHRTTIPIDALWHPVNIYWTAGDISEHAPIFNGADSSSGLRDGIEQWGDELLFRLPDLKDLGFEEFRVKDGWAYDVYTNLIMTCEGANVEVKCKIAAPGTEPCDERGITKPDVKYVGGFAGHELCEAAYNPFPRTEV